MKKKLLFFMMALVTTLTSRAHGFSLNDLTYEAYNPILVEMGDDHDCNRDGHSFTEVMTEPSCTKGGVIKNVCIYCGFENVIGTIPALGHDFYWVNTTEPTCTEDGVQTLTCNRCGFESDTRSTAALGHNFDLVNTTEPTCTKDGVQTFRCNRCGFEYNVSAIPALGHDLDWVNTTEPTCTEDGLQTLTCGRCGFESDTRSIPALGHIWNADDICERCGEIRVEVGDVFTADGLKYKVKSLSPKTVELTGYNGTSPTGNLDIPATVNDYSVTTIGQEAFGWCDGLTSVTIPEGVTKIGTRAFSCCYAIQTVTIPSSMEEIWDDAFYGCSSMTDVYCFADPQNGLYWTDDYMDDFQADYGTTCHVKPGSDWSYFSSLLNLNFVADLYGVGDQFVANGLKYMVTGLDPKTVELVEYYGEEPTGSMFIPATANGYSVTSIGWNAFNGCSSMQSVTIPEGVTSIDGFAFCGCSSLTTISIPANVTFIGKDAFSNCTGMTDVYCYADPTALTWDEDGCDDFKTDGSTKCHVLDPSAWSAFEGVVNVDFVGLNVGDQFVADGLKYKVTSLSPKTVELVKYDGEEPTGSLTIPATVNGYSVTSIYYYVFSSCYGLTSVTIPASVTTIGMGAFYYCTGLTSATISNGVTTIGSSAFSHCSSLESVTIPVSVTSIGFKAFSDCSGLTSITIPASVTSIGESAFTGCSDLTSVTLNSNPLIVDYAFYGIADGATVTMNLPANNADGYYWTTFYNDYGNFQADENTTVYKATIKDEGRLSLMEVEDGIVDKTTAVILKSTAKPVMTLTSATSTDTNDNLLDGVSEETEQETGDIAYYVLSKGSKGVGFYKLAAGKKLAPNKAFFITSGADVRGFYGFEEEDDATGINSLTPDPSPKGEGSWFTLDGRKVANGQKPTAKGVYIHNGRKEAIR